VAESVPADGCHGPTSCFGFEDITEAAGLGGAVPGLWGTAAALAHLDGDGLLDVIRVTGDGVQAWRNLGEGMFEIATHDLGLGTAAASTAVVPTDVNGDGHTDLVLLSMGAGSVWLGSATGFSELPDAFPSVDLSTAYTAALADVDGDGDLDMYVGIHPQRLTAGYLLHNTGIGAFVDATVGSGLETPGGMTLQAHWFDIDNDGDPDLALANDRGPGSGIPTQLFRNDAGVLVDVTETALGGNIAIEGMGLASGDYDGDGHLDLYVANSPNVPLAGVSNLLFRGLGGGLFQEVAGPAGAGAFNVGWGVQMVDVDADGHMDLLATGHGGAGLRLLRNLSGGSGFDDVTANSGLADPGPAFGSSVGDVDNDGRPDLLFSLADEETPVRLYRSVATGGHVLTVRLHGAAPNTDAIGARVLAHLEDRTIIREVHAGVGYGGANPPDVLFGLGDAGMVRRLEVRWPSGGVTEMPCVAADRLITVTE